MAVADDILAFSAARDPWQRDLLRRIYTQPVLTPADLDEVLDMVKAQARVINSAAAEKPDPLTDEHMLHRTSAEPPTVLASIGAVANANQLAANQVLPFAVNGLTIVYGGNGSGKTGYTRLLKGVCRARRERPERVLSNIYNVGKPAGPAEATIRYVVGDGPVQEDRWRDGDPPPAALSRISVFDAVTAPLYADKQHEIEYLPFGLDVLPRLAKACEDLSARIDAEIRPLEQQTVNQIAITVPLDAEAAALLELLVAATPRDKLPDVETIHSLAAWDHTLTAELNDVEEQLKNDPALIAAACRRAQAAVGSAAERMAAIDAALGHDAIKALAELIIQAQAARAAADLAASEQFKSEPLVTSIGSHAWQMMFSFAREFYAIACPQETFPGELCPLCQQRLSDEAHDRICRFHTFIENAARIEAERKEAILAAKCKDIETLAIPTANNVRTELAEFSADSKEKQNLVDRLAAYVEDMEKYRRGVLTAIRTGDDPAALATIEIVSATELRAVAQALAAQADEMGKITQDPTWRQRREALRAELTGRRTLHENLAELLERRSVLERLHRLKACRPLCDTRAISRKHTEMCKNYINSNFDNKLKAELKALGLDYLPIHLAGKTERGKNYVGPKLAAGTPIRCSNVLSDGEFQGLALACFFAEICGIDGHDGIIVDDPVSSLDHDRTRQVARRLVAEADNGRQVIVFTHELTFYYELWVAATAMNVATARHWIRHTSEHGFGTVLAEDSPWQAKNVKQRLAQLDTRLCKIRMFSKQERASEAYRDATTDFYTDLRETWERLVEENLLNGVVGRFQPGVSTQALRGVVVTDHDHHTVFLAMARASEYSGHDRARGRVTAPPSPEEMARDIHQIRSYMKELNTRRHEVTSRRRELESPPVAAFV